MINTNAHANNNQLPILKVFFHAARPATLLLAISSIICGSGLALSKLASTSGITWRNWLVLLLTLWVAMSLQVLSNLANDYGDGIKGTDALRDDVSPERMLARGQAEPAEFERFKKLIYTWALITFFSGVALIAIAFDNLHDFFTFLGLGIVAIIAAMAYTMGKKPYGYRAMGEISVLVFFGWLAVLGSIYLQTQQFEVGYLLPATGCGGFAACVMYINNMRDVYSDKQSGKITLAVLLGQKRMQLGYFSLFTFSLICYLTYAVCYNPYTAIWLLALPFIFKHLSVVQQSKKTQTPDTRLIGTQLQTVVMITLIVNLLFVGGLILSHFL